MVNCAGPHAAQIAQMAGIGIATSTGLGDDENSVMKVDLPVRPRKRMVFVVKCPDAGIDECPLVVLPSGAYFRMEGKGSGIFLTGQGPSLVFE